MVAIPYIIQAGAAIAAHYAAKKAAKSAQERAQQRSPEELKALTGATGMAERLGMQGSDLFGAGQQQFSSASRPLEQATSYYSTLLGGNRAAQAQATAAPRAAIGDTYRGAARGLERGGVQGAARDTQLGELTRERAGRLAALTTGVQPMAAEALAALASQRQSLGLQAAGTGMQGTQAGGNLYANLLGQGAQNRQQAVAVGTGAGQSAASTIGALGAAAGNAYSGWAASRGAATAAAPVGSVGPYGRNIGYETPPITGADSRSLSGAPGFTGIQSPYVPPSGVNPMIRDAAMLGVTPYASGPGTGAPHLRGLLTGQTPYRPSGYAGYYF